MYIFGIAVLFSLGVMMVAGSLDRFLPRVRDFAAITMVILGVLAAWLADFDLWELWAVPVRRHWIGVALSGAAIGGLAHAWHEVLAVLASTTRKTLDEAESIERSSGLRVA
jgi:predicted tellurium resistance membrane protein TerC